MTADERDALRTLIDGRRRELVADDDAVLSPGAAQKRAWRERNKVPCERCGRPVNPDQRNPRAYRCHACATAGLNIAPGRRARLLAACASGSPVAAEVQVRAVLRMLETQARIQASRAASAASLDGSMADAAEGA